MSQLRMILIDGLILFVVSTALVIPTNEFFSHLKVGKDDPLVTAIVQGKTDRLEEIAAEGESVTGKKDEQGRTALMRVAYVNVSDQELLVKTDTERAEMVPILLNKGAPLEAKDYDGWTALMWASWSGLPEVANHLLDAEASHRAADKQGNTALTLAAARANAGIVSSLLAKGADPGIKTKAGKSALDLAKTGLEKYPDKKAGYDEVIALLEGASEN